MAAAQEFSSPGEHMASISSGPRVVDAGRSNGTGPGESNVIWSPGAYENLNRGYQVHHDEVYGSSARERADRYNQYYMNYNNTLFNSAMDYDRYMSNTAIQRQVEDLKKAGLNPILAARLGGAVYKGVNAPYLSISPSSALNSFLDYGATMYQTDVSANTQIETTRLENASREFVAKFQEANKLYMQGELFKHDEVMLELKKNADRYLDAMRALDNQELQRLGFENDKKLSELKHNLDIDFYRYTNKKTFDTFGVVFDSLKTLLGFVFVANQMGFFDGSSNPIGFVG